MVTINDLPNFTYLIANKTEQQCTEHKVQPIYIRYNTTTIMENIQEIYTSEPASLAPSASRIFCDIDIPTIPSTITS